MANAFKKWKGEKGEKMATAFKRWKGEKMANAFKGWKGERV